MSDIFNTTKCGVPAIPLKPFVFIQDCVIEPSPPPIVDCPNIGPIIVPPDVGTPGNPGGGTPGPPGVPGPPANITVSIDAPLNIINITNSVTVATWVYDGSFTTFTVNSLTVFNQNVTINAPTFIVNSISVFNQNVTFNQFVTYNQNVTFNQFTIFNQNVTFNQYVTFNQLTVFTSIVTFDVLSVVNFYGTLNIFNTAIVNIAAFVTFTNTVNFTGPVKINNVTLSTAVISGFWARVDLRYDLSGGPIYDGVEAEPVADNTWNDGIGIVMDSTINPIWERNKYKIPYGEHVMVWPVAAAGDMEITGAGADWQIVVKASGGVFSLRAIDGGDEELTAELAFDAAPGDLEAALEALSLPNLGDCIVTGSGTPQDPYIISLGNAITSLIGEISELEDYTSYVCDYEAPGGIDRSIQFNNGQRLDGHNNTLMDLTYGVPEYPSFSGLSLIALDSSKISMPLPLNTTLLAMIGSGRTYALNTNGTTWVMRYVSNVSCEGGVLTVTFMNATFTQGLSFGAT